MPNDNVTRLIQPGFFDDQLTEILRNGARALLAKAVEAEVAADSARCRPPFRNDLARRSDLMSPTIPR
ncbi:hypothetical protein ABIC09_007585 [Bradyrhizobium sp. S3.12.5]